MSMWAQCTDLATMIMQNVSHEEIILLGTTVYTSLVYKNCHQSSLQKQVNTLYNNQQIML